MDSAVRCLRYFLAVGETLNFRGAADALGLTQPALSRSIAKLESELGLKLFERTNRQVALTEAGRIFRDGCRDGLSSIERAAEQARRAATGNAGQLKVGYTDIAIAGRLAEIVRSFRDAVPDVGVTMLHAFTEEQLAKLKSGEIDVGFVTGPVPDRRIEAVPVQIDRLVAVLPSGHGLAGRSSVRVVELANEPFILGEADAWRIFHRHLYEVCRAAGYEPMVIQRSHDTQGIIGLVACGMGVSIQAEHLPTVQAGRVAIVPLSDCERLIHTFAIAPHAPRRMATGRFIDHLRAHHAVKIDRLSHRALAVPGADG